ncbi:MAG: tRNA (adenosine(37)-N6)-threonylcarbamoyltransferase complex ATPase subunit type 1 TsaE [Thermoanaerobaculaceae bacterium]
MLEAFLPHEEATFELGRQLAGDLLPGDLVLLVGPLGAGKTTFVRGLVQGLGGDPAEVCSPSFILRESYSVGGRNGIGTVHHLDLYRLRGNPKAAWEELGLVELLDDPDAVTLVEWGEDLLSEQFQPRTFRVELSWEGDGRRVRLWKGAKSPTS